MIIRPFLKYMILYLLIWINICQRHPDYVLIYMEMWYKILRVMESLQFVVGGFIIIPGHPNE